jgi:hypothetical protein
MTRGEPALGHLDLVIHWSFWFGHSGLSSRHFLRRHILDRRAAKLKRMRHAPYVPEKPREMGCQRHATPRRCDATKQMSREQSSFPALARFSKREQFPFPADLRKYIRAQPPFPLELGFGVGER